MVLEKINNCGDIKKLDVSQLNELCQDVRRLIIDVVSRQGGHLASSLGAVELTAALHYCLDLTQDAIIFDVGHQCYAHKILSGRRDRFRRLRERGGISGFPNPAESGADPFISGHASCAASWAQGMAEAKRLKNDNSRTVAVIGDGSLTGGMCFEALNNCGHAQSEVLIVFNHNEMSISTSVGALSKYLNKIISAPVYNRIRDELESFLSHHSLTKKVSRRAKKFEEALKGMIIPGIFFEELGFRYFGPIDGHNLDVLIPTVKNIASLKGPKLLHVVTQKGKGYKFSEENPERFHSASPFVVDSGLPLNPPQESFGEAFVSRLVDLGKKDEKIVAVTAAMPKGTGLDLFGVQFPQRLFDVGIAEAHAVGFAAGLAREGFRPVVAIYSTFMQRSLDQIIHDVALQNLGVIFALDRAGVVGEDGPTHHGVFDVGYLRFIPNIVCMAPKDKNELEAMLDFAHSYPGAVAIRYPRGKAYTLSCKKQKIRLAEAEIMRRGKEVCIVALGSMVKTALQCVDILSSRNIDAGLINARFAKPLDEHMLRLLAREYRVIVTLEEACLACGFGSAVLEFFEKEKLLGDVNVERIGFPDQFIPAASRDDLFKMYRMDPESLAGRIKRMFDQGVFCPEVKNG